MFHAEVYSIGFNLERASILLLDADRMSMTILAQILEGFGARRLFKAETVADAKDIARRTQLDLVVVDPGLLGEEGFDFPPWLRRQADSSNRFAPILVVIGHTPSSRIAALRDCGANFVVAKPLTPSILYERLRWMARDKRPNVETSIRSVSARRSLAGLPIGSEAWREAMSPATPAASRIVGLAKLRSVR